MDSDDETVLTDDNTSSGDDDWFFEVSEDISGSDNEGLGSCNLPEELFVTTEPPKHGKYSFMQAKLCNSGCTKHISPYHKNFNNSTKIPPREFLAANKQSYSAIGKGEMVINIPKDTNVSKLQLTEVLYSPEVSYTLVSIGRVDEKGFSATFSGGKCAICGPKGEWVGKIPKINRGLYKTEHEPAEEVNPAEEILTVDKLYWCFGHISPKSAQKLVKDGFVTGLKLEPTSDANIFCESCIYAKAAHKTVPKTREGECTAEFGDEIHTDVWGPAPVESKGGKCYYITYTNDSTLLTNLYLLAKKSNAYETYKDYDAWCMTQLKAKIKVLHSNRGGEYLGKKFTLYLKSKGTKQKLTVHDTPQQNGVAKWWNRTIVEHIQALLHSSGLPKSLWGEAACHIVWLMNRTLTKAINGMTPYKAAFGKKSDLKDIRKWGEKVWVCTETGSKLGGCVRKGRWLGIDERSKGVHVYWPKTKTISVKQNIYVDKMSA